MGHLIKILAKNYNGELSFCRNCKTYHLHFNNLFFELNKRQFKALRKHINRIEFDFWDINENSKMMKRTIPMETLQENMILMFSKKELESLKDLLFLRASRTEKNYELLNIDYSFSLN